MTNLPRIHGPGAAGGGEAGRRRARPLNLVRAGAFLALFAGAAWTASGLVALAAAGVGEPGGGGALPLAVLLGEALYAAALAGTLGGIVALHARQTPGYGPLGAAGFVAAFAGTGVLLAGIVPTSVGGPSFLDPVLASALWAALLGFTLMGLATVKLGALPGRCGWSLVVCVPLAIVLGDYGGGVVLGLTWLLQGHALLSQRDLTALLRAKRA